MKKENKYRSVKVLKEDHDKLKKWADQQGMKIYAIINHLLKTNK